MCRSPFTAINVCGKRKRTTNVEDFRNQVRKHRKKLNRKEIRKLKNNLESGLVLRQIESITPAAVRIMQWKFFPATDAKDGDIRTMEEAKEKLKLHSIAGAGEFNTPIILE